MGKGLVILGILLSVVIAGAALFIVVYPKSLAWSAPLFCDDDRVDEVVVSDTYSPRPGETSTTFTLYCIGPRGVLTEVPWWKASVVPTGAVFAGVMAIPVLLWVSGALTGIFGRLTGRRPAWVERRLAEAEVPVEATGDAGEAGEAPPHRGPIIE